VSTVNNHLANAYFKLGIAGRRELVALLGGKL
jgi:DNA-binding CsgD family transcriptional regulator